MEIVKAEILWTRKCPLKCHYCNMVDGRENTYPLEKWIEGIDALKDRGCKFIAFYGAEPLYDQYKKLAEVIGHAEVIGVDTTIITGGTVPNFKDKIKYLYDKGLRSLSMSYDMKPLDDYSRAKSSKALESLEWFQKLGEYRDTAAIATLTRTNFKLLPETIKKLTSKNIWTFFDFIHPDRGQEGSKCKGDSKDLLFREEDFKELKQILLEVKNLKTKGYLCHSSHPFIEAITHNNFEKLRKFNWNCAEEENFPAWITIDCDGQVGICDDFRPAIDFDFKIHEIGNQIKWLSCISEYKKITKDECPGCCWNTHIDAHLVKDGILSINDYVHRGDK